MEIDTKYLQDLKSNPDAAEYLNKFNEEFANASFKKKNNIHKGKKYKIDSYDRNNARNRCIYTREKAQGALNYTEDILEQLENETIDYEENLIDSIDYELSIKKLK